MRCMKEGINREEGWLIKGDKSSGLVNGIPVEYRLEFDNNTIHSDVTTVTAWLMQCVRN